MIYWALLIYVYEMKVLKKVRPLTGKNAEMDIHKKYPAFRRTDHKWFTNRLVQYFSILTFVPRFAMTAFGMIMMAAGAYIIGLGLPVNKNDTAITGVRYFLMRVWIGFWARWNLTFISAVGYISHTRPKTCYKKYLGPDWKADYDGNCGTLVANH